MAGRVITLLSCVLLASASASSAQDIRIGVLGIFRPHQLTITATPGAAVIVQAGEKTFVLEPGSRDDTVKIGVSGEANVLEVRGQTVRASTIHASSRNEGPVDFVVTVPGKISRHYRGSLDVRAISGVLTPIVTMDLETAVASVVQAESAPGTPLEALKAQAVVTRSYFVAGKGRHHDYDFCDTSHCQFLREPPSGSSLSSGATLATRGLVLAYRERPFAAMFTPSCGGKTHTPRELGIPTHGYPYFAVVCGYCRANPVRWSRRVSQQDAAALLGKGEAGRLAVDRRLGWSAVPSNSFTVHEDGKQVVLEGTGRGHGIGLCQRGSSAMAAGGATYRQILDHYYPDTSLISVHALLIRPTGH